MDKSQTCFAHRSITKYFICMVYPSNVFLICLHSLCSRSSPIPHNPESVLSAWCSIAGHPLQYLQMFDEQQARQTTKSVLGCCSRFVVFFYPCLTIPEFLNAKPRTKTTQSTLWTLWKSKQSIGTSYIIQSTYKSWHTEKKIHSNTRKLTRCKTRVRSSLTANRRKTKNTTMNTMSNNYEQYREEQVLPCAIPPIHYILI